MQTTWNHVRCQALKHRNTEHCTQMQTSRTQLRTECPWFRKRMSNLKRSEIELLFGIDVTNSCYKMRLSSSMLLLHSLVEEKMGCGAGGLVKCFQHPKPVVCVYNNILGTIFQHLDCSSLSDRPKVSKCLLTRHSFGRDSVSDVGPAVASNGTIQKFLNKLS